MSERLFIDTSVLVASILSPDDESSDRELMERIAADDDIDARCAWHCLLEFYSVVTRLPEEYRVSPTDAEVMIADFAEVLRVHSLPSARRARFFRDARDHEVVGGSLYDFHIGEIARSFDASVFVTGNARHFRHLEPTIEILSSEEWLRRSG